MSPYVCSLYILHLLVGPGAFLPDNTGSTSSTSYGDLLADDLKTSGDTIVQNVHEGVVAVADPMIKFTVDTLPQLIHLYAIINGVDIPAPLAALGKDIYGRLALLVGKSAGKAGVLASEMAKGGLNVGASGLGALNNVLKAGALAGIQLGGKGGDITASATLTGGNVAASGLTAVGDGLLATSAGTNVLSGGISKTLDAIGAKISQAIATAEKLATKLLDDSFAVVENGVITFNKKQQERTYLAIQSFTATLSTIQVCLNNLAESIKGNVSANASTLSSGVKVTTTAR